MNQINLNTGCMGRISMGIKTPIIRTGDDLTKIVIDSCLAAVGQFHEKAVIGVTEAVLAISQGNYAKPEDIQAEIARLYPGERELTLLFPIQSRNRFMNIPKAIAEMPQIEKIYVALSYPCDEVGNRLVSEEALLEAGVEPYGDAFTSEEFYARFGKPVHPFTGKDYIEEFEKACNGKAEVILVNDLKMANFCKNVLVCTIREEARTLQKKLMKEYGAERVYDLTDILSESVDGSGFSEYGLLGSNMMGDGVIKLMPLGAQQFVENLQKKIKDDYGTNVEVFVYGDGAFKDPVGGIWELADPVSCLGATAGLGGTPKEVKAKYIASQHPDATPEELAQIIAEEKKKRMQSDDVTDEMSLGTTPRQITDLIASLADLTTGSGDECTPVVYVLGYLK